MNKRNISYRICNRKNTRHTLKNRKKQKGGLKLNNETIKRAVEKWCLYRLDGGNGHISNWDTSSVTNMRGLFKNEKKFNDDISKWNVSNVTNMNGMFNGAAAFNQPIDKWDVSNVTTMLYMFKNATAFNQDLTKWKITKVDAARKETKSKLKYYMQFGNRMEERNYPIFGIEIREEERKEEIEKLKECTRNTSRKSSRQSRSVSPIINRTVSRRRRSISTANKTRKSESLAKAKNKIIEASYEIDEKLVCPICKVSEGIEGFINNSYDCPKCNSKVCIPCYARLCNGNNKTCPKCRYDGYCQ